MMNGGSIADLLSAAVNVLELSRVEHGPTTKYL